MPNDYNINCFCYYMFNYYFAHVFRHFVDFQLYFLHFCYKYFHILNPENSLHEGSSILRLCSLKQPLHIILKNCQFSNNIIKYPVIRFVEQNNKSHIGLMHIIHNNLILSFFLNLQLIGSHFFNILNSSRLNFSSCFIATITSKIWIYNITRLINMA